MKKPIALLVLLICFFSSRAQDTLLRYYDMSAGLAYAKMHNKYAVVYYEPNNCRICEISAENLIGRLKNNQNLYSLNNFNENYILIMAQAGDTAFLKQTGIRNFPAFAILTGDKEFLYYNYNVPLYRILRSLAAGPDNPFGSALRIHYLNTYEPEIIRKSGYKPGLVKKFLQTYLADRYEMRDLAKGQDYYKKRLAEYYEYQKPSPPKVQRAIVADTVTAPKIDAVPAALESAIKEERAVGTDRNKEEEKPTASDLSPPSPIEYSPPVVVAPLEAPDTTFSLFNAHVDESFILQALDSLIAKQNTADSATAALAIEVLGTIDYAEGCLYVGGQSSSLDGHHFQPRVSFNYLVKNFKALRKYRFIKYRGEFLNTSETTAYVFISRRLNRFICLHAGEHDTVDIQHMLAYQKQFADAAIELQHLEMPLLITNILNYAGKQHMDTLLQEVALPYLDRLLAAPQGVNAFVPALSKSLAKNHRKETDYIVTTYDDPADNTNSGYTYYYPEYFKNSFSRLLWRTALHYYEKEQKDSSDQKRIKRYALASLSLTPNDPFSMELNAYLAYDKGDRQTALKYINRAVVEAVASADWRRITDEQINILKQQAVKIKAGTR